MIVTVRRWTSIALPRFVKRAKTVRENAPTNIRTEEKQFSFLESYGKMFEHQVNLMFKEELK